MSYREPPAVDTAGGFALFGEDRRHDREESVVGIGLGTVVVLVGLVLTLGVLDLPSTPVALVSASTVGWVLIVVGAVVLLAGLGLSARRQRSAYTPPAN